MIPSGTFIQYGYFKMTLMDTLPRFCIFKNILVIFSFLTLGLTSTSPFSDHSVTYTGPEIINEGYGFIINCVMNRNDLSQWTIDEYEITDDNDRGYMIFERMFGTFQKELTLKVEVAQLYHDGEYRCNGYSREFHELQVIEADDGEEDDDDDDTDDEDDGFGISMSGDQILDIGKTITMHCTTAESDKTPVFWYKNYKLITPQRGSRIQLNGTHLTIENAQIEDAAEYMCTVDFLINTGQKEIGRTFEIKSPAKVKDFPRPKMKVVLGKKFTLDCNVQGFPRPKITWYKDNLLLTERIHENPTKIWLYPDGGILNRNLTVQPVDYEDQGLYTCKAENIVESGEVMSDEKSIFVYVQENIIETNEDEGGLKLLVIGQDLFLQCNTTDCPECNVVWFKNGVPLIDDEDDDRITINNERNSITINKATYNDTGIYVCAINRDQLDIALNASIEVQSEIKIEKFQSASDVVVEGHSLELYCHVTAAPPPSIKWFKGDDEIDSSDERIQLLEHNGLAKAKLFIEEAEFGDRNNYSCEAYNRVHSSRITIFIRVKDKLAALWPFLGICAEVAILCTIIFVYEKRKSAESNETDTDVPADNTNVGGQPQRGEGVRQRK